MSKLTAEHMRALACIRGGDNKETELKFNHKVSRPTLDSLLGMGLIYGARDGGSRVFTYGLTAKGLQLLDEKM